MPRDPHNVLVLRLDALGDFVLWLDAAAEMRRRFPAPHHRITLLGNAAWIDLARLQPHWDAVWSLDRRRFRSLAYRWNWVRRIRQAGFGTVINPAYSRENRPGDWLVRFSGADRRVASTADLSNLSAVKRARSDGWYTELVAADPQPLHELDRNAEFLRGLGAADAVAGLPRIEFGEDPTAFAPPAEPYCVLFPGAGWDGRRWPAERFAAIGRRLLDERGWRAVIAGGPADRPLGQALAATLGPTAIDACGHTDVATLCRLIAGARLVVSNETSAVHIAAATATPAVCVLGGGHYGRYLPYPAGIPLPAPLVAVHRAMPCYHCNWNCIHPRAAEGPVRCIDQIATAEVWQAIGRALSSPP